VYYGGRPIVLADNLVWKGHRRLHGTSAGGQCAQEVSHCSITPLGVTSRCLLESVQMRGLSRLTCA